MPRDGQAAFDGDGTTAEGRAWKVGDRAGWVNANGAVIFDAILSIEDGYAHFDYDGCGGYRAVPLSELVASPSSAEPPSRPGTIEPTPDERAYMDRTTFPAVGDPCIVDTTEGPTEAVVASVDRLRRTAGVTTPDGRRGCEVSLDRLRPAEPDAAAEARVRALMESRGFASDCAFAHLRESGRVVAGPNSGGLWLSPCLADAINAAWRGDGVANHGSTAAPDDSARASAVSALMQSRGFAEGVIYWTLAHLRSGRAVGLDWTIAPAFAGELRRAWEAAEPTTLELACRAAKAFGGPTPGLFNTAGFQQALGKFRDGMPTSLEAATMLGREPRIVRLSGGSHWLILPEDFRRATAPEERPDTPEEAAAALAGLRRRAYDGAARAMAEHNGVLADSRWADPEARLARYEALDAAFHAGPPSAPPADDSPTRAELEAELIEVYRDNAKLWRQLNEARAHAEATPTAAAAVRECRDLMAQLRSREAEVAMLKDVLNRAQAQAEAAR